MQISRWRNFLSLKTHIIPLSPASTYLSSAFHSTPCSCQKWKNKWNSDVRRNQQPSKNHVRFVTRQKRADAKKALNNLLYNSGSSRFSSQNKETRWKLEEKCYWHGDQDDDSDSYDNKGQPKSRPHFGKSQKRKKRKIRRESFNEDFDGHAETIFHATFGNRGSTWSFNGWRGSFGDSTSGFERREHSNWTNSRSRNWKSASDTESDDDSCCVGLRSDRTILGLPPRGPLKIDDVKNAFRLSALKWHPDKHQGPSQAMAEEKFKLCVNAYKSLCSAISSA